MVQSDDTTGMWLHLRRSRLTSSNFGVVCKRRATTPVGNLVKTLLYRSASLNVSSLRWGRENEDNARKSYAQEMQNRGTPVSITGTGLIIYQEKPHLGCSPDDLVADVTNRDVDGTAEYKCPYSARELLPVEACIQLKSFFCKVEDGVVKLKHSHQYYYQVQGVLAITKRSWCDFVVWTPKGISVERIQFDPSFWQAMVPKLDSFYHDAILPELTAPEHPHRRPIREPGTW